MLRVKHQITLKFWSASASLRLRRRIGITLRALPRLRYQKKYMTVRAKHVIKQNRKPAFQFHQIIQEKKLLAIKLFEYDVWASRKRRRDTVRRFVSRLSTILIEY